jgi:hypothetical protein
MISIGVFWERGMADWKVGEAAAALRGCNELCPWGLRGIYGEGEAAAGEDGAGEPAPAKSQGTPCLVQLPHAGCISSHWRMVRRHARPDGKAREGRRRRVNLTLIFRTLHLWQPALDFLWDLLGGISRHDHHKIQRRCKYGYK